MGEGRPLSRINEKNLPEACHWLASADGHLATVLELYGTPPLWARPAGFATLLRIILEQQVSLASARACFEKLEAAVGEVTPEAVLTLNDAELKSVGFSRQKTAYARHLSAAVIEQELNLDALERMPDPEVKSHLQRVKGVGEWTSDIYLLMALRRPDIMPRGDIALHAAYQKLASLGTRPAADDFLGIAARWSPFRSVAARILWHFYLSERARS
ncbi:MAG: DNA-3-methyladenine glycosylase 2 family protein [Chloracidobacterium sp.]|nr:DNA-3-methyladenine glycosylase 2 family protein [Chloracidobacterium sp.]